ncbi:MAG: three-Cys-motif partner protein TcmP [candidate division Zixibacteria bacterium]|nr:three-Cys-motif partner protein TcmP [candidate division Zixibacteria bacterium]
MRKKEFFDEARNQSIIKAAIVSKYFDAWANVISGHLRRPGTQGARNIGYIDLFAGPGKYKDGTQSTPMLVLEKALNNPNVRDRLIMIFNDKDPANIEKLRAEIEEHSRYHELKNKPQFYSKEIGSDIAEILELAHRIPSLSFVDPWGYKGLSRKLIASLIADWGCDCIFFFNFNRVNAAVSSDLFRERMSAIFSAERLSILTARLIDLSSDQRELTILEELTAAMSEISAVHILPFCFKDDRGRRTSHHIILVTKHFKGYEIMKDIMAKYSTSLDQGVPSFVYNQATKAQPFLFELTRPLDELSDMLLEEYAGRELTMDEIYAEHSLGKPYIKKNYKDVLRGLEERGHIRCSPAADDRKKQKGQITFADSVKVTFLIRRTK